MQKLQTMLKEFWAKVKGFFGKLNKGTRILLSVCLVVVIGLLIAVAVKMNQKDYAVLCTGLSASETSSVVQFLNENGVTDYRIQNDSILVPADRQYQLQSELVLSGNLNSGFLYPYYTGNTNSFSTETERKEAARIALEQRLEAVIRQFDGVRDANVNITLGSERKYVLQDSATKSSAAVVITPDGSRELSSGVIEAIRNTVTHSVQELDIEDVSIEDIYGNPYDSGSQIDQMSDANSIKLQVEQDTNNKVRREVLTALGSIYGEENVKVSVNCTADVDRRVVESTSYSQPEGSVEGGGLIGTETWFWEIVREGGLAAGGTVGTPTNSDINLYPDIDTDLDGDENLAAASGERDHNIDTVVEQKEVLAATITDISVSVTINQNAKNAGSVDVERLTSHVAVAAGIGMEEEEFINSRVSVLIAPFDDTVPGGTGDDNTDGIVQLPSWALYAAIGGLILFIILLILVLVLRSRSKKKKQARQAALEAEALAAEELAAAEAAAAVIAAAPPAGGADIMEVNTEKSMELRKAVRQFAQNNPEIAAQMVKSWLKGEDGGA